MHSDKKYSYGFLEVTILVMGLAVLPAQTLSADPAPAMELPPDLRLTINRTMGRDQAAYHFRESGAGCFEARYAALGADVLVGPKGLTVRTGAGAWTLGASAPSLSGNAPAPGLPRQTAANRVEVDRGWAIEWVVNGPTGLEQGWDIPKRPLWAANEEELLIPLKQDDNLRAMAAEADGRAICVRDAQGLDILRYAGLHVTDAAGRELPARFETRPGAGALWIKVTDTSAAYPITIDPWVESAKLFASDRQQADHLGYSVALSSNGLICAAGAYGSSPGGSIQAGAVYIFTNAAGSWSGVSNQTAKLFASDGQQTDNLGWSVALSADGGICAAGAYASSPGGMASAGAVYIFKNAAGSWSGVSNEAAKLLASDRQQTDNLGWSVALSADGGICAAGAPHSSPGDMYQAGAVYIFTNAAGSWTGVSNQAAKLFASDGQLTDSLGRSVALSADGGICAAGAYNSSPGGVASAGAAYIFKNAAGSWSGVSNQTAKLFATDKQAGDYLGCSVALSADGGICAAGAFNSSPGGTNQAGAVYIFTNAAGSWSGVSNQTAKLFASDGQALDNLGCSVALSADGGICAAGACNSSPGGTNQAGAVYIFTNAAGSWSGVSTQAAKLFASNRQAFDNSGFSVALSADGGICAAGACNSSPGGTVQAGAVYVFANSPSAPNCSVLGINGAVIASGEAASAAKGSDFGSLPWSSISSNTFAITNTGSQLLTISNWRINGAGAASFTLTNPPSRVEAGSNSNFMVIFCPAGAGVFTGVLSIVNNSTNSPFAVNLAGAGYRLAPSTGPAAGGNTVALTNGVLGNGSDITNIIVGGMSTTNIIAQAASWVRFVAPANTAGLKDVVIQSASKGTAVFHNAYTYNPAGVIYGGSESSAWTHVAQATVPGFPNAYGMNNTVYGLDCADGILYAGGAFTNAGGSNCSRIARYNGTAWSEMGMGVSKAANVNVVRAWTNGIMYAGGYFTNIGGCNSRAVAKWTGTNWESMGNGLFFQKYVNGYVNTLEVGPNGYVYAGGYFTNSDNSCFLRNIAQWNGSAWTNMGAGFGNVVSCLAVTTNGEVYAGGPFTNSGSFSRRYVAKWNGTAWTNVGIGFGNRLTCLAAGRDGVIYAGGWFTNSGSTRMNYVAKWNGTTWTNMGEGFNNWIYALEVGTNGEVYAGGSFTNSGSVACPRIAKWNGTAWTNLDAGMSDTVLALTTDANNALYAGGFFRRAGGLNCWYIAKWTSSVQAGGVNPTSGSYAGGFPVTITGTNLGNGADITYVTLCGVRVSAIVAQSCTQVVVTAGSAFNTGVGDVCVYSESFGMTVKSNIFTYNGAPTNLSTPGGVSATYGTYTDRVRVTWIGVAGATSYDILRNTTPDVNGATSIAIVDASRTYYDDYSVVARQSYYYWVRALSGSGVSAQRGSCVSALSGLGVSALSYAGMGYAELGSDQMVGCADLTVSDMVFLPVNLTNGSPAGTVSYRLANGGPDTLVAAPVRFDFYMVQSNQAAWMAYNETDVTLAVGVEQLIILDASARQWLRVRDGLAGPYTVQARVRHLDLMGDQHTGSNTTDAAGTVLLKASGVNSIGRSFNDYDGDGKADGPIYHNTDGRWYVALSGYRYQLWLVAEAGLAGLTPVPGDYDGDGITDMATFNRLNGWWTAQLSSTEQTISGQFGGPGFTAAPCDFDGDAKTDPVIFRDADGLWAGLMSSLDYAYAESGACGSGYQPLPEDYDGDRLADVAMYNQTSGMWAIGYSGWGYWLMTGPFGGTGWQAAPADYDGDGLADPAIYNPSTAAWQILISGSLATEGKYTWQGGVLGNAGGMPVAADYDGDGKADIAVYHQDTGLWQIFLSTLGYRELSGGFGGPEYQPVKE